jgi:4-amino-4-deoxy-L-arabinose transferase-like glycosyltransferase
MPKKPKKKSFNRFYLPVFTAILVLSFLVRAFNPGMLPAVHSSLLTDESRVNVIARNVAQNGTFTYSEGVGDYDTSFVNAFWTGPLTVYTLSAFFFVFGASYAVEHVVNAFFGAVLVLCVFLFGRRLYGKKAGLLAAAIAGLEPLIAFHSRIALHDTLSYIFLSLSLLLVLKAETEKKRRAEYLLLSGALVALSAWARYSGALGIVMIIAYMAIKKNYRGMPLVVIPFIAVLALLPLWAMLNGPAFYDAFMMSIIRNTTAAGIKGTIDVARAAHNILYYYPFITAMTAFGVAMLAVKRYDAGKALCGKSLMLWVWIATGFLWWIQSLATQKYSLIFGIPLYMVCAKIIIDALSGGKTIRMISMLLLISSFAFYAFIDCGIAYDFRDDSAYRMADAINSLDDRVLFSEAELSFLSGKSLFPFYWADTTERRFETAGFEQFYNPPINETLKEYMEREQPRYIVLSEITKYVGSTPRKEFREYAQERGILIESIGPYRLYELSWE